MLQPADQPGRDTALSIDGLSVAFETLDGVTRAVRDVSLTLGRGRTLAIVGESGSGKSVTSYSILRLIQPPGRITAGRIVLRPAEGEPIDITVLSPKSDLLHKVRGGMVSMIFQEPMTALSPVHTIGNQLREAIRLHRPMSRADADQLAAQMLGRVGIPDPQARLGQYPFEFSGGMRQRVVIAMALVCQPEVLIADEPTTALDVTTQAQILTLIADLKREMGSSVIFITHDLGVVAQVADDVVVMKEGRIVEAGPVRPLFRAPWHPYTKRLLLSIPRLETDEAAMAAVRAAAPAGGLPEGLGFKPPPGGDDGRAEPVMVEPEPGRTLLLWPQRQPAGVTP